MARNGLEWLGMAWNGLEWLTGRHWLSQPQAVTRSSGQGRTREHREAPTDLPRATGHGPGARLQRQASADQGVPVRGIHESTPPATTRRAPVARGTSKQQLQAPAHTRHAAPPHHHHQPASQLAAPSTQHTQTHKNWRYNVLGSRFKGDGFAALSAQRLRAPSLSLIARAAQALRRSDDQARHGPRVTEGLAPQRLRAEGLRAEALRSEV